MNKRSAHNAQNIVGAGISNGVYLILVSRMKGIIFADDCTIIHKYFTFLSEKSIIDTVNLFYHKKNIL